MYFQYFSDNFILNFLPSFLFLVLLIFFSFYFSSVTIKKKIFFFDNSPFLIFVTIIAFFTIIFNYLVLFREIYLLKYSVFLFSLLIILYFLINLNKDIKFKSFFNEFKLNFYGLPIIIYLPLFLFFLISILPLSDSDSISSHLYFPVSILEKNNFSINLPKEVELLSYLNNEVILFLSPILKSDNFGSQLNFFSLLILIILLKKNRETVLLWLTCPLMIFFISTQKLQLFFAIIYLFSAIFVFNYKVKNKLEIFIICFLITFYSSGKMYYPLFSIPLLFVFFYKNNKYFFNIIFFLLASFLLIFFPILLNKFLHFSNPVAPFFSSIFLTDNNYSEMMSLSLRSSEGWLNDINNIKIYFRAFMPTSFSNLSSTLGLGFLLLLINYKEIKNIYFLPYLLIFFIILVGQILPRYYFESFLILSYFAYKKSNFMTAIIYIQGIAMVSLAAIFCFIAYFQTSIFLSKDNFMNKFSMSYERAKQISKLNLNGNILNLDQSRESIFLHNNSYSSRYLNAVQSFKGNEVYNKKLINFIKQNKIIYIVKSPDLNLPDCIRSEKISTLGYRTAVRNFLKKTPLAYNDVHKVIQINCK